MRDRRGNYSILFVLTATVMLSYLAFSIDGGRQKIAAIQAENAAEAATLAAVAAIRDGETKSDAESAAQAAADQVRLQRLKARSGGVRDFDVDITWGRWRWDEDLTAIGSRWQLSGVSEQSATINVSMANEGIVNIFGPAVQMMSEMVDGEQSQLNGEFAKPQNQGSDQARFSVSYGARAAMRHRDTIFVVDVSRYTMNSDDRIIGIQQGLASVLDTMDELGVPADHVSLVGYAGNKWTFDPTQADALVVGAGGGFGGRVIASESTGSRLYPLSGFYTDMDTTFSRLEPCDYWVDSWYLAARHVKPAFDAEITDPELGIGEPSSFNWKAFRPIDPTVYQVPALWTLDFGLQEGNVEAAEMAWAETRALALGTRERTLPTQRTYDEMWEGAKESPPEPILLPGEFCDIMAKLELGFMLNDPRRDRFADSGFISSPLMCHQGNWYEGNPARIDDTNALAMAPAFECAGLGDIDPPGVSRYRDPSVLKTWQPMDLSYFEAGSDPATGLLEAADILEGSPTNGEPTVVWVTSNTPRCSANVGAEETACLADRQNRLGAALNALDDLDANVHVVSVGATPDDEVALEGYTQGRGIFVAVADPDDLDVVMDPIARDIRLQVVQ